MCSAVVPRRIVTLTDVDPTGDRHPLLVTADPHVVAAVERAVGQRVRRYLGGDQEQTKADLGDGDGGPGGG